MPPTNITEGASSIHIADARCPEHNPALRERGQQLAEVTRERDAALARAEQAEAERDALQEECDSLRSACHTLDQAVWNCPGCAEAQADLTAARAELAALGPVEYEIPYHGVAWQPRTELNSDHKPSRAIRVVKEAQ